MDALKADPAAWNALAGIASHSYNMAATPEAAKRVLGTGKQYWMTEASDNGPEVPGDAVRAASLASRFLNDMNHGVTHWVHFVGFEVPDPNDNATRILAYTPKPFAITTFQKYYYYRQLSRAFDVGAVFRASQSSLDGDMTWTYGRSPASPSPPPATRTALGPSACPTSPPRPRRSRTPTTRATSPSTTAATPPGRTPSRCGSPNWPGSPPCASPSAGPTAGSTTPPRDGAHARRGLHPALGSARWT